MCLLNRNGSFYSVVRRGEGVNVRWATFTICSEVQKRLTGGAEAVQQSFGFSLGAGFGAEVELELGLGAGGADGELAAAMQAELQNVGGGKAGCWREIVRDFCDGKGGDFCRRIFTQALHAACHVPHGARAGKGEALLSAAIIAVGLIERVDCAR